MQEVLDFYSSFTVFCFEEKIFKIKGPMINQIKRYPKFKLYLLFSSALIALSFGSYYFYNHYHNAEILNFNPVRDTAFILDSFKRDWYWLIEGNDYSPEYTLQNKASSRSPEHKGNLTIKVAYENNKPVGFVIYFMENFYLGDLRFIDVNPEFRSRGWAYKLLDYAVKDLIKRGSVRIKLVTRTTNYPAQKLYLRYGFKEVSRDNGFVYYEYIVQ